MTGYTALGRPKPRPLRCAYHVAVSMRSEHEDFKVHYGGLSQTMHRTLWRCSVLKCPFVVAEDRMA